MIIGGISLDVDLDGSPEDCSDCDPSWSDSLDLS